MSSDERTSTADPQTFASYLHVDVNASKMMPTVASTAKPEGVQKKLRKGTKSCLPSAVIVLLGLIGYGRLDPPSADISLLGHDEDSDPILRTRGAIEQGARTKIAGRLSAKCCAALDSLIASAQSSTCSDPIVLPYFGTLSINPLRIADPELQKQASSANISVPADAEVQATPRYASGVSNLSDSLVAPVVHESNLNSAFVYQGPFLPSNDESHWLSNTGHSSTIGDMDWTATQHFGEDSDWSWLNSDLPPTLL
ncbi:hypothetical protein Slin15195_G071880 [Septoria linicola]|uniref:Uncharacterized protein n=1 Tax=Septoria linicola TaxID=215465 RepID=A0A9Q9AR30_9PEZI|nr:hypothetical protein Slin15195_G071880 [Septoria linicola]